MFLGKVSMEKKNGILCDDSMWAVWTDKGRMAWMWLWWKQRLSVYSSRSGLSRFYCFTHKSVNSHTPHSENSNITYWCNEPPHNIRSFLSLKSALYVLPQQPLGLLLYIYNNMKFCQFSMQHRRHYVMAVVMYSWHHYMREVMAFSLHCHKLQASANCRKVKVIPKVSR